MTSEALVLTVGIYPPDIGGPASYVERLSNALVCEGHQVTVVTTTAGRSRVDVGASITTARLSRQLPLPIRMAATTARIVRASRHAAAIYSSGLFLESSLASLATRRPLVVKITSDGAWDHTYNTGLTDTELVQFDLETLRNRRTQVLRQTQRLACVRAATVIVSSRFFRGIVRSWGVSDDRLVVIPNATEIPSGPPRFEVRPPPAGRLRAITVGRMVRSKRFPFLVELAAALPELELTIVGEGPDRPLIVREIERLRVGDRVRIVGPVAPADMGDLYRDHDAFLLAASSESFSYATIEAMAHGLPVVVADSGALPEVAGDGRWGLVCPTRDLGAWSAAVRSLCDGSGRYRGIAQAGHEAVRANFGWPAVFHQTVEVLLGAGRRLR